MVLGVASFQGLLAKRIGFHSRHRAFRSPITDRLEARGFDLDDNWAGESLIWQRDALANKWLRGDGIEIGALHMPVAVPPSASVRYVDYKTLEENRERYPELHDQQIVVTDIVDDGFILRSIDPESVDFIIANHALEHSPNPYGTLRKWGSKLSRGGVCFIAIPIADTCYDRGRPITSLAHFINDDQAFELGDVEPVLRTTLEHLIEFLAISDPTLRIANSMPQLSWREVMEKALPLITELESKIHQAMASAETARTPTTDSRGDILTTCHVKYLNRVYDVHYHTFSPRSYHTLLQHFCDAEGYRLEDFRKSGGGECIGIIRKK